MEEFLGILFAGGRGTRLGEITRYISKAFVPVYDRPVFMYPLALLESCRAIHEVVVLTNDENDARFAAAGNRTLMQDDARVHDMLSGLQFVRESLGNERHAVLMPCDNVSQVDVTQLVDVFLEEKCDVCYSVRRIDEPAKLRQMGVYDPATGKLMYRPANPPSIWGMIAPYVVHRDFRWSGAANDAEAFNQGLARRLQYDGMWFDVGDPESLVRCSSFIASQHELQFQE
ncbi:MAG TPA: NTP transferase domain-containing protein [Thermoanaerobaculia bacterium]